MVNLFFLKAASYGRVMVEKMFNSKNCIIINYILVHIIPVNIWKLFLTSKSRFYGHSLAFYFSGIFEVENWVYMSLFDF